MQNRNTDNDGKTLKFVHDSGATANILNKKFEFLLKNGRKSDSQFRTMNGVMRSKSVTGELGILTGITSDGSFNLVSPQTVLRAINDRKNQYEFRQVLENGIHRVDLYRNETKLLQFARSLQNEKLMYLTKAALDYLKIVNVPERALANEEISQKTPKTPRNTQSTDWKIGDVSGIMRQLGPMSLKRLKQIADDNRILGLRLDDTQIEAAKKKLDAGFLRTFGGIITGKKSQRIKSQNQPLSVWMFDQLCHKVVGRKGETHCTIFYPMGDLNYVILYCHRGLKCMPYIVNLWINKVKMLRKQMQINEREVILIDNQVFRREGTNRNDQVGIKVLYGDSHLSNSSKELLEVVSDKGALVHLFPTDRRNALHELDSVMNRLERIAEASLMYAKLGHEFWPDALKDAVYRFNRLPGTNNKKSAFETLWGFPPGLKEFFPCFGSTAVIPRNDGKGGTMEAIYMYKRTDASACFYCPQTSEDCVRSNYQIVEAEVPGDRIVRMWLGQSVLVPNPTNVQPTFRHSRTQNCKVYDLYLKNHPFKAVFDDLNTVVRFECCADECGFTSRSIRGLKSHITKKHSNGKGKADRMEKELHKGRVAIHQVPRLPFEPELPVNYEIVSPNEANRRSKVEIFDPKFTTVRFGRDKDGENNDSEPKRGVKRSASNMGHNQQQPKKARLDTKAKKTPWRPKNWKPAKTKAKPIFIPRRSKRETKANPRYSKDIYAQICAQETKQPETITIYEEVEKKNYIVSESSLLSVSTEKSQMELEAASVELESKGEAELAGLLAQKCKVETSRIVKDRRRDKSVKEKAREARRKVDRIIADAKKFEKHIENPPGTKRMRNELPEWVDPLEAPDCISKDGRYPKVEPKYALLTDVLSKINEKGSYDPEDIEFKTKDKLSFDDGSEEEAAPPISLDEHTARFTQEDETLAEETCKNINRANVKRWEPKNIKRATNGPLRPKWIRAIEKELENINGKASFSLLKELTDNHVVLRTQWVFKIVINEDDSLKFKARLVLRGDLQKKDSIPPHTESPVVESLSINIVLAIASMFGLACHTADIDGAYLTAKFQGNGLPVAIAVPQGCRTANGKCYLLLNRNLYGSVQGAAVFFSKLVQVMVDGLDYIQSNYDPCIMFKEIDGYLIIMAVYVDDLIILCKPEIFDKVMKEIIKDPETGEGHFKMKHYGRVPKYGEGWKYYLGRQLCQCYETFTIYVSQSDKIIAAATNILKDLNFRYQHTPVREDDRRALKNDTLPRPGTGEQIRRNNRISNEIKYFYGVEKVTNEMVTNYMRMTVGILGYLGMTGVPEIITVTNMLARYIINPSFLIVKIATDVFKYLYTKRNDICVYGDNGSVLKDYILWGFSDASYGDVKEGMRSTAGHCIFVFGNLIAAKSYVIKSVCRSVTEAEIKAMSEATSVLEFVRNWMQDEIIPRLKKTPEASKFNLNCVKQTSLAYREKPFTLKRLKDEIQEQPELMSLLGYDNSATQQSVVNKFYKKKLRHVRIHASYIHYAFHVQKSVVIVKMPTAVIPSDLFTKLFGRQAHERLTRVVRNRMNSKDVRDFEERTYKYDFPRIGTNESLIITNDENVDRLLALLVEEEDAFLKAEKLQD